MKSDRYIRQTTLKDFGPLAQQKLAEASILVVGIGGLGIPVLQYLNAMGVGTLGMMDQDVVGFSNLQRQILYSESDIGRPKLEVALERLSAQNTETTFKTYETFLVRDNALEIIADFDVVIDTSDNFPTRYLVNDACVILNKPFIYGALHGFEGQVSVFNYQGGPTYRCLFPQMPSDKEIPNCDDNGVLGVIPGIVGSHQALEAVKVITGIGEVMSGKLLIFNGLDNSYYKINFPHVPENLTIFALEESYGEQSCAIGSDISMEELQQLLEVKDPIQLIDVRSAIEFREFHLPNSINIPLAEFENRLQEIDSRRPVYLLCQTGKRSRIARQELLQEFSDIAVYNVVGGIGNYRVICS